MKNIIYILSIFLTFTFISCVEEERFIVEKIIAAKSSTENKIAFTDRTDAQVSFGIFSTVDVGDTIVFNTTDTSIRNLYPFNSFIVKIKQ